MMDRPSSAGLLAEARRLLLEDLLALLPSDRRYDARMIANAMAIAARELEAGDRPLRDALNDLAILYDEPVDLGAAASELERRFMELGRRLATDIRRGLFDNASRDRQAIRSYLRDTTAARLRVSNPKVLTRE